MSLTRQARLGVLVLGGVALFLLVIFAIAGRSFLFTGTFELNATFNQVAGLRAGAPVHFHGIAVGRVEHVQLPARAGDKITVRMAIRDQARHLIRQDTHAQIKTEGLVGNQMVVLAAGSESIPMVDEGDFISGVDPFDLFEITDTMLGTVSKFDSAAVMLYQIMGDVRAQKGTLGKFVYDPEAYDAFVSLTREGERFLNTLGDEGEMLVQIAEQASQGINSIIQKIDEGDGTVAKMLNDPGVYDALLSASDQLRGISEDLRVVTDRAEDASNWGALAMYRLAENMEALRHNWFFKRYFEERGFMERAPFETRERAIEESHRALEERRRELQEWEERLRALEARLTAVEEEEATTTTALDDRPPEE